MNGRDTDPQKSETIFEINLIGQRLAGLLLRRAFERFGAVVSLALLLVSALLCFRTVGHLSQAIRVGAGVLRMSAEFSAEKQLCDDLDAQRFNTLGKIGRFSRLVPIARTRVAWAPKLVALADALPKGMGVALVRASSGEVFADPMPDEAAANQQEKRTLPAMTFSIIYLPTAADTDDPMGDLLESLRGSEPFMTKMDFVRLEATEEENWRDNSVIFFQGLLKGAPPGDET